MAFLTFCKPSLHPKFLFNTLNHWILIVELMVISNIETLFTKYESMKLWASKCKHSNSNWIDSAQLYQALECILFICIVYNHAYIIVTIFFFAWYMVYQYYSYCCLHYICYIQIWVNPFNYILSTIYVNTKFFTTIVIIITVIDYHHFALAIILVIN